MVKTTFKHTVFYEGTVSNFDFKVFTKLESTHCGGTFWPLQIAKEDKVLGPLKLLTQ